MYRPWVNVFLTVNSCAWPLVFAAFALVIWDISRLWIYVAAGAIFGGVIFFVAALLRWLFTVESLPAAPRLIGAGLIMFALGGAGLVFEVLLGHPQRAAIKFLERKG